MESKKPELASNVLPFRLKEKPVPPVYIPAKPSDCGNGQSAWLCPSNIPYLGAITPK